MNSPHTNSPLLSIARMSRWRLDGATALVTGGTKGIGLACVEELLDLGAHVLLCSRSKMDVDATVARLSRAGQRGSVAGVTADVGTPAGRAKVLRQVDVIFGGILNILINNVGTNARAPIGEATEAQYAVRRDAFALT